MVFISSDYKVRKNQMVFLFCTIYLYFHENILFTNYFHQFILIYEFGLLKF